MSGKPLEDLPPPLASFIRLFATVEKRRLIGHLQQRAAIALRGELEGAQRQRNPHTVLIHRPSTDDAPIGDIANEFKRPSASTLARRGHVVPLREVTAERIQAC